MSTCISINVHEYSVFDKYIILQLISAKIKSTYIHKGMIGISAGVDGRSSFCTIHNTALSRGYTRKN